MNNGSTITNSGGLINTMTDPYGNYLTSTYSQMVFASTSAFSVPNVFTNGTIRYLTINGAGPISFSASVSVADNGILNLTTGTLSGTNLTMGNNATIIRTGGTMSSTPSAASSYNVEYLDLATGSITTGSELPSSSTTLKNLIVDVNAARPLIINSNATVNGNMFLWVGSITNSNKLTLANGATITRSGGAFDVAPNFAGLVNLNYIQGYGTTGTELPSSPTVINNLAVNSGYITTGTTSIAVTSGGSGYAIAPNVTVGTPWTPGTAYTVGQQVVNGSVYTCIAAGTSSTSSFGPSDFSTSITDGTVTWQFAGFAATSAATVSAGSVTSINVTYSGTAYTSVPTVQLGTPWSASKTNYLISYTLGSYVFVGSNLFTVTTAGYSGNTAPSGTGTFTATGSFGGTPAVFTYAGTVATATAVVSPENIYLGSAATVNGTVNLNGGDLVLQGYNLTANKINGNSSNYVVTNSTGTLKVNSLAANTIIPIGNSITSYAPLQFASATSNTVTMSVSSTLAHTPLTVANTVGLQWSLLASGAYTSNVTFQYNAANQGSGYTSSGAVLGTYTTSYSESALGSVSGSNPFTVTKSALVIPTSSASLYVIGDNNSFISVPGTPASVTPTADNAQVYIAYTAPSSNGGSAIIDYAITAIPSSGSNIVRTGITANPYTFTGLTNGTTYTFTIAARNAAGTGSTITSSASTPSSTTTWNGTTWSAGAPDPTQIAIIAANFTNTTPLSCTKFTVNTGVTFVNNSTMTVLSSPVTINGTVSGTGTLVLNGSSAQSIAGSGIVSNLTVNNASGATITGTLDVTGVLNLQAGTLTTNNNLTLKSTSITNSAILGPVGAAGNTGSISGYINVERYIPQGFRAYRDISANGVYDPTNTLFNTWQESGSNNPGYGMFITGGAPDSTALHIKNGYNDAAGLDRTLTGYSSAYYYKAGWDTVTNTKTTYLNPFQSYRVLIRGDRNFNLDTTPVMAVAGPTILGMHDATTLRTTGAPITGTVTFRTSGITNAVTGSTYNSSTYGLNSALNGYTYLANPYACPIVFDSIYNNSTGISPSYYYLDPTISSTGAYVSYNVLSGSSKGPGTTTGQFIQAGQGFLIGNNNNTSPIVVLNEAYKATGSNVRTFIFGVTTPRSSIGLSLMKLSGSSYIKMDVASVVFGAKFNNGLGLEDATKMSNASDNLAFVEGGHSLSIDGRLPATSSDVLPISLNTLSGTSYNFVVDASEYNGNGIAPYLHDAYNNTTVALSGIDTIAFTANASVAATYQNRFSIVFKPTTLSVNSIVATATANGNIATIQWNTVGEKAVANYTIEKSVDGTSFTSIGQQVAKNTATASYTATDKDVVATTSYYRIKAISEDGTIAYSNVVKLTTNHSPLTTIYPNPLTGKTLNIELGNVVAGKYVVSIYNSLGQKVTEQAIDHAGGNSTHSVNIESSIAKGVYNVVIRNVNSKEQVFQSTLSVQ